jgi:hypothetical protein
MRSNIARQLYNTGGITNLINTYQNNPTLQSQMTQEEYLDLFNSQPTSTNTTEQIIQSSTSPTIEAPVIRPLLPIIPQEGGDGGGGITSIDKGLTVADDYGLGVGDQTGMGYQLTEKDLEDIDDARFMSGIKSLGYDVKDLYNKYSPFSIIKKGFEKAADFSLATKKAKDEAAAKALAEEIALQAQRDRLTYSGPAFTNQDGSTISQDFSTPAGLSNYDADVLR